MHKKWLLLGSFFLTVAVIGIGLGSFHELTRLSRSSTSQSLRNVLESTTYSINTWIHNRLIGAMDIAVSRELRPFFQNQINLPRNRRALLESDNLPRIRAIIGRHSQLLQFFDFSLIAPDNVIIASDNDESIGKPHVLSKRGDFLKQVISGKSIIVPPISVSVDALESLTAPTIKLPVMFVAVPVSDDSGRTIAALLFHLDPEESFSPISRMGRIGRTGETYFVNKDGMMLTNSRFENELRAAGLLKQHQTTITNFEIRDPGGDLRTDYIPELPIDQWPLTFAAAEAIAERPGINLDGYRDYRGVSVVGAWAWHSDWNFGIVTELDYDEAYESTNTVRWLLLGVMAALVAVFTSAGFLLYRSRKEAILLSENLAGALEDLEGEMHERRRAESFLRASEYRVRLLLDSTSEAIYGLDLDGKCTFANPSCARLLGYEAPADILGLNMHDLIHYAKADGTPLPAKECPIYKAFILGEESHGDNEVFWRKNGSSFFVEYWSHPIVQDGKTTGAVVAFLDITNRKKARKALLENEEKYRHLFQFAQIGMFRVSTDGKTILTVNDRLGEVLGYSQDDLLAFEGIERWTRQEDWNRLMEEADQTGVAADFEIELTTAGGEPRIALASVRKYADKGFIEGSIIDITEQRKAREKLDEYKNHLEQLVENRTEELEEANRDLMEEIKERRRVEESLRTSEQQLQDVVDNTAAIISVKDTSGRYLLINKTGANLIGKTPLEIVGLTDYDILPPAAADRIRDIDTHVLEKGVSIEIEEEFPGNETRETLLTNKFPLRDVNGAIYGVCGISTDISKRKVAEEEIARARDEAEAANRAKSEFLANMSHEIRTPMNGIIGMAELVLGTELDPEQRDFIETALSSARSLMTLLNSILDLSKIEANRLALEKTPFILEELVLSSINASITQANSKGLELAARISPEIHPQLEGDPTRLRQILTNLVGNAVKFTGQGEVVVSVDPDPELAHKDMVRFSVKDTGIGIPPEKRDIIFSTFTQADGSTTRKFGGSGLGLTISKRLVEIMGGRIWIENNDGPGVTFIFSIPLTPNMKYPLATIPKEMELDTDNTVLIVDDNLTNRRILEETLRRWGMNTVLADRASQALALLEERPDFDLMLIDFNMPEMNGFELINEIQRRRLSEAKIIMLTSAGTDNQTAICRSEKVAACLYKPVGQTQLYYTVLNTIGKLSEKREPDPALPIPEEEATSGLRILVAEDNPVNQKLAQRLLEKKGYSVRVVPNGTLALTALEEESFDLILMDIQMPEKDGLETTRLIREREKQGNKRIPIVAMTAHAMKGDRERFIEAGMDEYVSKPFKLKELHGIVQSLTQNGE